MTIERIRANGGWPKLRAKGNATRHTAKFALHVATLFLDKRRQLICQMMLRFYDLLDEEGHFLSDSAKLELPILGRRLCGLYNVLACEAVLAMEKRWKSSPKMHVLLGFVLSALWLTFFIHRIWGLHRTFPEISFGVASS